VPFWRSFSCAAFRKPRIDQAFALLDRVGSDASTPTSAPTPLSGGQRQRVGIARALEQEPGTAADRRTDRKSLDPKTSRQIMRLIDRDLPRARPPSVINIHDVALAQMFVDRIIGLRAGRGRVRRAARRARPNPC
jgi:phosphonate transport system ATP-binding protein